MDITTHIDINVHVEINTRLDTNTHIDINAHGYKHTHRHKHTDTTHRAGRVLVLVILQYSISTNDFYLKIFVILRVSKPVIDNVNLCRIILYITL